MGLGLSFAGARKPGSKRDGGSWDRDTLTKVWNKAALRPGYDASQFRLDACGAIIEWTKYGDVTENGTGWEVDHIRAVANGGSDDLSNLQALQWQNNRHKSDNPWNPSTCCKVSRTK